MTGTDHGQAAEEPRTPDAGEVKAATTREAVLKALLDEVKAAYEDARTDVQHLLDRQERVTGARQFTAHLPDGAKVGTVALTGGEPAAQVTDEAAFTAWARQAYPAEAVTRLVKTVSDAFTAKLLDEMTAAGVAVDPSTGEQVPGVAIRPTRKRSHSVRFTKNGRESVGAAWRTGTLAPLVLPALAAAGPTEADQDHQEDQEEKGGKFP